MKPLKNLDYVELYSEKLRENSDLFIQQKKLIETQLHSSSSLFKSVCGNNFKLEARKYLRGIGLLK